MDILIHACCGICLLEPARLLRAEGHTLQVAWLNPNIQPHEEHDRRLEALLTVTKLLELPLTRLPELPYDPPTKRLTADRCAYCYRLRLLPIARLAKRLGMAFTTTLLYSKYQRHEVIRRVAEEIAADLDVPFFYQDWRPRFNQGQSHARQLQIYRQRYCGCQLEAGHRFAADGLD